MPHSELELVNIGSRFSTQRLIEQGNVSVAVARAHAADLGNKYPQAKVDELAALIADIQTKFGTQADAKTAFSTGNVPVDHAIDDAKRWIGEVISAADNAFEEDPEIGDEYHKGGKIGRSVPKISGRMQALLALAEGHKGALVDWGIGDADLEAGRKMLAALSAADTAQEQAVKNLPAATKELYVQKAKAFLLLKKLARTARTVFKGDPATRDKLALDILMRRGHKRGAPETPAAEAKQG